MVTFALPSTSMISIIQVFSIFSEHEKLTEAIICISLLYFGSYPTPHTRCTHTATPLSPLPRDARPSPQPDSSTPSVPWFPCLDRWLSTNCHGIFQQRHSTHPSPQGSSFFSGCFYPQSSWDEACGAKEEREAPNPKGERAL